MKFRGVMNYKGPLDGKDRDRAEAKGLVVLVPNDHELFIDADDEQDVAHFEKNIKKLGKLEELSWYKRPSSSGNPGRYHFTVTLKRPLKNHFERILLQALLGSDLNRELISLKRRDVGDHTPTLFFEKPEYEKDPFADSGVIITDEPPYDPLHVGTMNPHEDDGLDF